VNIAKTKIDWKKIYSQRERKEVIDKTYAPQTTSAFDVWYAYQYTSPTAVNLNVNELLAIRQGYSTYFLEITKP
jgi:fumarate hydratase class II